MQLTNRMEPHGSKDKSHEFPARGFFIVAIAIESVKSGRRCRPH